jgi:hypothetical protein
VEAVNLPRDGTSNPVLQGTLTNGSDLGGSRASVIKCFYLLSGTSKRSIGICE